MKHIYLVLLLSCFSAQPAFADKVALNDKGETITLTKETPQVHYSPLENCNSRAVFTDESGVPHEACWHEIPGMPGKNTESVGYSIDLTEYVSEANHHPTRVIINLAKYYFVNIPGTEEAWDAAIELPLVPPLLSTVDDEDSGEVIETSQRIQ